METHAPRNHTHTHTQGCTAAAVVITHTHCGFIRCSTAPSTAAGMNSKKKKSAGKVERLCWQLEAATAAERAPPPAANRSEQIVQAEERRHDRLQSEEEKSRGAGEGVVLCLWEGASLL